MWYRKCASVPVQKVCGQQLCVAAPSRRQLQRCPHMERSMYQCPAQHNAWLHCTTQPYNDVGTSHFGPAASIGCLLDDRRKKGLSNPACATCAHPNLLFCVEVCCQLPACSSWLPKQEVKSAATCGVLVPAEVFAGVHTSCVCCLRSPVPRSQHQEAGDAPHAG